MIGISDQASANYAVEGSELYRTQQFDECQRFLDDIEKLQMNGSVEVDKSSLVQNRALCAYSASSFKDSETYKSTLEKLLPEVGDDVNLNCLLYYNYACALWHCGQLAGAEQVLVRLLQVLEPLDNAAAKEACYLLIEVYLTMCQPEKANNYISFLDKCIVAKKVEDKDSTELELVKRRMLLAKVRCHLMLRNSKVYRKDVKLLAGVGESQQYRITLFKAQQEHLRGNYRKAVKYLSSVTGPNHVSSSGECLPMVVNNAFSCTYTELSKPHLSMFYLKRAFGEYQTAYEGKPLNDMFLVRPAYCRSQLAHFSLLYNMGITALQCGLPMLAFECLRDVVKLFPSNIRAWLRLAEACIGVEAQREGQLVDKHNNASASQQQYCANQHLFGAHRHAEQLLHGVIGSGIHRKVILATANDAPNYNTAASIFMADAVPTLQFAALCLDNVLCLLPETDLESLSDASLSDGSPSCEVQSEKTHCAPPGNPISVREVHRIRCSALCASAYVRLCLSDFMLAIDLAKELLGQPYLSGVHKMLANLYCAEGYVMLDRANEAVDFLQPASVTALDVAELWQHPSRSSATESWHPASVSAAQGVVLYNLAVTYCYLGEYKLAGEKIQQISQSVAPNDMNAGLVSMALYVRLRLGQFEEARRLILQHYPALKSPAP